MSSPPLKPPSGTPPSISYVDEPEPIIKFPGIENAAKTLLKSEIVDPIRYYGMRQQARQNAFTISTDLADESINKIKTILAENIATGPDRVGFIKQVNDEIDSLPISEAHLENVFRTTTLRNIAEANNQILSSPMVIDAFAYRRRYATHDGRTRLDHLALEHAGLNGTGIYLSTDPFWIKVMSPTFFSCRCKDVPYTIKQAARNGVQHAINWLANIEAAKEGGYYTDDDGDFRPVDEYVTPIPIETWSDVGL